MSTALPRRRGHRATSSVSAPRTDGGGRYAGAAWRRSRPSSCSPLLVVHRRSASPGWDRVQATYFDLGYARDVFPELRDAFWLNIKLFLVAEVCILAVALLVAVIRVVPSPALAPLKLLAVVYTDVFRGTPTLLVIFLVGFGVPALQLQGAPTDLVLARGHRADAVVRRVRRRGDPAGIVSVHPSQWAAVASLGLTYGQTLRHVVLPQAIRRVMPPLLNDFVSLQKDTALVAALGLVEILRAGADQLQPRLQLHAVRRGRNVLHRADRAAGAARPTGSRCARSAASRGQCLMALLRLERGAQALRRATRCCRASRPRGRRGGGRLPDRCLGLRQVDVAALRQPARDRRRRRRSGSTTRDITDPRVDADEVRREIGIVFQAYNLFPHLSVLDNITLGPRRSLGRPRRGRRAAARELLDAVRAGGEGRGVSRQPLRWSAAAGRGDPGDGDGAEAAAARRDHLGARPDAGRRGARR